MLLKIIISDLDYEMQRILSKFVDDTKFGEQEIQPEPGVRGLQMSLSI